MYSFGARSQRERATLHPELIEVLDEVIKHIDFAITKGRRGRADQNGAVAARKSTKEWPRSRHNCPIPIEGVDSSEWPEDPEGLSQAVDVAPWNARTNGIDWEDREAFAYLAGQIMATARAKGFDFTWGNDWDGDGTLVPRDPNESFSDMPHIQRVKG